MSNKVTIYSIQMQVPNSDIWVSADMWLKGAASRSRGQAFVALDRARKAHRDYTYRLLATVWQGQEKLEVWELDV